MVMVKSLLVLALALQAMGPAPPVLLQTNGATNAIQGVLNLAAGTNVTLANTGSTVTISASGAGGSSVLAVQTTVAAGDTATANSAVFANGSYTFAANTFCPSVGTVYAVHMAGNLAVSTGGGDFGNQLILNSGTNLQIAHSGFFMSGTSAGPDAWSLDATLTCVATGASGAVEVDYVGFEQPGTSANGSANVVTNTPNTAVIAVNTTVAVTLASWSQISGGAASIQERQFIVRKL